MVGDWIVDSKEDMNKSQTEKGFRKETRDNKLRGWNGKQAEAVTARGKGPVSHRLRQFL